MQEGKKNPYFRICGRNLFAIKYFYVYLFLEVETLRAKMMFEYTGVAVSEMFGYKAPLFDDQKLDLDDKRLNSSLK